MTYSTYAYFAENPTQVWERSLRWREECAAALPNAAHHELVRLQQELGNQFALVTQNVDGLHRAAGSYGQRYIEVHGSIDSMRCLEGCLGILPIADAPVMTEYGPACSMCAGRTRPHVLWFDEFYDEENYRARTARSTMASTSLLVTVGTSGVLPMVNQMARIAARAGAVHIDINPEDNPLRQYALGSEGRYMMAKASIGVPYLVAAILDVAGRTRESAVAPRGNRRRPPV